MRESIKKIINEVLGVPSGVLDSSEKLYGIIGKKLSKIIDLSDEEWEMEFRTNLEILDFNIKKIDLTIKFVETDMLDKVAVASMAFGNQSKFSDTKFVLINVIDPTRISLSITFAGPERSTEQDMINCFKETKNDFISSLAHELTHAVNFFKKGRSSVKSIASYAGYQRTSFPFKPIQDFLHYLYFIHSIENIVRPSEVASLMKSENIDKEKFYDFLLNNTTYKMLQSINNFSYINMREELKRDYKNVKEFLKQIDVDVKPLKTKDDLVTELLRIVYINLVNNSVKTVQSMMTNNFLESFLGFQGEKNKFFDKMIKFFSRFDKNPEEFYLYEEKNFKYVSEKMMKKLIKLYDLAKTNPSSIKNWELHHKINRTGEQFETELMFKPKKNKKQY
jgi:hypothetical protein